jgi:hypothetical protein
MEIQKEVTLRENVGVIVVYVDLGTKVSTQVLKDVLNSYKDKIKDTLFDLGLVSPLTKHKHVDTYQLWNGVHTPELQIYDGKMVYYTKACFNFNVDYRDEVIEILKKQNFPITFVERT